MLLDHPECGLSGQFRAAPSVIPVEVSLLGKSFDLLLLLPQWERIPVTRSSTPALPSVLHCMSASHKPHCGNFTPALHSLVEDFQFSCAQLSMWSREKSFHLVGVAPSQVLRCKQESHEMLLSGADPALRHSVTWKFPILQGSYIAWDSWSHHGLSLWI